MYCVVLHGLFVFCLCWCVGVKCLNTFVAFVCALLCDGVWFLLCVVVVVCVCVCVVVYVFVCFNCD